jgi:hypothetical protein
MKNGISRSCAWFIASLLMLVTLPALRGVTPVSLSNVGSFALGGVGVAGTMSAGENALRALLNQPGAVAQLEGLISSASPAGKLYALLGLRLRDRAAYARALEKSRGVEAKVETARGCMLSEESFRDLVKEIEKGDYDSFLAREWPEHAR